MKAKEIEALESHYKTGNEHWNGFAFDMLCEVLKQGQFENSETPLQLFSDSIDIFMEHHEHPLKAVDMFVNEMTKNNLNPNQKLFICEWICKYLNQSSFEEMDLSPIKDLMKSQKAKLEAEAQPLKPLTRNIRETLKSLMQKELEILPETLKGLEPVQRLNILCKLMPFVLPKVDSIDHRAGEPWQL